MCNSWDCPRFHSSYGLEYPSLLDRGPRTVPGILMTSVMMRNRQDASVQQSSLFQACDPRSKTPRLCNHLTVVFDSMVGYIPSVNGLGRCQFVACQPRLMEHLLGMMCDEAMKPMFDCLRREDKSGKWPPSSKRRARRYVETKPRMSNGGQTLTKPQRYQQKRIDQSLSRTDKQKLSRSWLRSGKVRQ